VDQNDGEVVMRPRIPVDEAEIATQTEWADPVGVEPVRRGPQGDPPQVENPFANPSDSGTEFAGPGGPEGGEEYGPEGLAPVTFTDGHGSNSEISPDVDFGTRVAIPPGYALVNLATHEVVERSLFALILQRNFGGERQVSPHLLVQDPGTST
jgi:hypothetical protein